MDAFLAKLVVYGPLGIWAAVASLYAYRKDKDHHATRDSHESRVEAIHAEHAKAFASQAKQYADATTALVAGYEKRISELEERGSAQLLEMSERILTTAEAYAAKHAAMTEKVAVLVDAMSRSRG